jgi:hypothetical protein
MVASKTKMYSKGPCPQSPGARRAVRPGGDKVITGGEVAAKVVVEVLDRKLLTKAGFHV